MLPFIVDVKIKNETMNFHYCARAIIELNQKILIVRVNDADYYHLPGGHVEIGETSANAVLREIKEETNLEVKLDKLTVIDEQFYTKQDSQNHSLIFYYLARPQGNCKAQDFTLIEPNRTKTIKNELRWVTREALKEIDLRPKPIKDFIIQNQFQTLRHTINGVNEI